MKNLSLKLDEHVFTETEEMIRHLKMPRNRYINTALKFFNNYQSTQLLKKKLQKESMLVRKDSMKILADMEKLEDEF